MVHERDPLKITGLIRQLNQDLAKADTNIATSQAAEIDTNGS
jgi:hypothetical protein